MQNLIYQCCSAECRFTECRGAKQNEQVTCANNILMIQKQTFQQKPSRANVILYCQEYIWHQSILCRYCLVIASDNIVQYICMM